MNRKWRKSDEDNTPSPEAKTGNPPEVAKLFFKLGLIAFGGPAAHTAMMEDEVVTRRKWMISIYIDFVVIYKLKNIGTLSTHITLLPNF